MKNLIILLISIWVLGLNVNAQNGNNYFGNHVNGILTGLQTATSYDGLFTGKVDILANQQIDDDSHWGIIENADLSSWQTYWPKNDQRYKTTFSFAQIGAGVSYYNRFDHYNKFQFTASLCLGNDFGYASGYQLYPRATALWLIEDFTIGGLLEYPSNDRNWVKLDILYHFDNAMNIGLKAEKGQGMGIQVGFTQPPSSRTKQNTFGITGYLLVDNDWTHKDGMLRGGIRIFWNVTNEFWR